MSSYLTTMEPMHHLRNYSVASNLSDHETELPPRPQTKTVAKLHEEMEQEPWYWRALAFAASMLIAIGFLVFGGAFRSDNSARTNAQTTPVTVVALIMINSGYILSVGLWYLRRNWLYQLECIFVPCFISSFLGFLNSLLVPELVLDTSGLTAPALVSLLISLISTSVYAILAFFTWRRIQKLRNLGPRVQQPQESAAERPGLPYVSEEEQQRRQMEALLQRNDNGSAASISSQKTYQISMPLFRTKTDGWGASVTKPVSDTY